MNRTVGRLMVVLGSVVVLLAASSIAALPSEAKGNKVLYKNSLKKASKALQPASGDGNNTLSTEFIGGKYVIHSKDPKGAWLVSPIFNATATQLAKVRIDVDVSLANVPTGSTAGVFCRRSANANPSITQADKYVFLVGGNGDYSVFKDSNGASNQIQGGSTTVKGNKAHLRVECKGAVQPAATDSVNFSFGIDTNSFSVTDSQSPLQSGRIGLYANGLGDPGFSNLTVTQL